MPDRGLLVQNVIFVNFFSPTTPAIALPANRDECYYDRCGGTFTTIVHMHASHTPLFRLDDKVRETIVHQRHSSWSLSLALRRHIRGSGWIVGRCESLGHRRSRQLDQCDIRMHPNSVVQQCHSMSVATRFMASNGVFRAFLVLGCAYL